jgi:hypothetical protein
MIKSALQLSGNQYANPDSLLGYGIPNTYMAMIHMGIPEATGNSALNVFPNPFGQGFTVQFNSLAKESVRITLFDELGNDILQKELSAKAGENKVIFSSLNNIPSGVYFIRISGNTVYGTSRLLKLSK